MVRYLTRRLATAVLVLFVLSVIVSLLVRLIPGDPAAAYLDPNNPDPALRAEVEAALGLDRSWGQQYVSWIGGVLSGDWGSSLTQPWLVGDQLAARVPVSLTLALMATLLAVAVAVPLGVISAVRPGGALDSFIRGGAFAAIGIPAFVIATIILLVNSVTLQIPLIGYIPFNEDPLGSLGRMLLPALTLALPTGAMICRYTRGTVIDALQQDFIRTAVAKGAPVGRVVVKHALRNGLIPVVTVIGLNLAALIGGTVIIENVFALPGLGSMLITAINSSDYPTIQSCVLVIGAIYVLINLVIDLLYPLIDPRVRTA